MENNNTFWVREKTAALYDPNTPIPPAPASNYVSAWWETLVEQWKYHNDNNSPVQSFIIFSWYLLILVLFKLYLESVPEANKY